MHKILLFITISLVATIDFFGQPNLTRNIHLSLLKMGVKSYI